MKILFNTYQYAFQNAGGGEIVLLKTKEYLEKRGHEVHLFDKWKHKIRDYDIVHDFSLLDWRAWDYYQAAGVPLVLTPTCWPAINFRARLSVRIKAFMRSLSYQSTHPETLYHHLRIPCKITPTSYLEKNRILKLYGSELKNKMTVIPNGIDRPNLETTTNSFQNKYGNSPYVLYVGSIAPNKNTQLAIKMAQACNIKIYLIGDASVGNKKYYEECLKLQNEKVQFLGRLPHDAQLLADAYRGAQVLLVPSHFETCSLVALEAGAFGTNVVLTKHGGTKEIFKDYVYYVEPADFQECCEQLTKALKETSKNTALQKFILENYTWDKIVESLEQVYLSCKTNT